MQTSLDREWVWVDHDEMGEWMFVSNDNYSVRLFCVRRKLKSAPRRWRQGALVSFWVTILSRIRLL